jgi:hypothetical protein
MTSSREDSGENERATTCNKFKVKTHNNQPTGRGIGSHFNESLTQQQKSARGIRITEIPITQDIPTVALRAPLSVFGLYMNRRSVAEGNQTKPTVVCRAVE